MAGVYEGINEVVTFQQLKKCNMQKCTVYHRLRHADLDEWNDDKMMTYQKINLEWTQREEVEVLLEVEQENMKKA